MKTVKNKLFMMVAAFFLILSLVPSTKAQAAQLATPTGITLNDQANEKVKIQWNFDSTLMAYYNQYYEFGYEVVYTDTKDKVITTSTCNTVNGLGGDFGFLDTNYAQFCNITSNSKFKKAPFKVKIRSFVTDGTNYMYSDYSAPQLIVPRASIKKVKATSGSKAKVYWNKVSGAKNYTLYISSNGTKFKKVTTTSKTSASTKKLKKYKNYYVYVQANKVKVGKKKYNSTKPVVKGCNGYKFYIYTRYR